MELTQVLLMGLGPLVAYYALNKLYTKWITLRAASPIPFGTNQGTRQ